MRAIAVPTISATMAAPANTARLTMRRAPTRDSQRRGREPSRPAAVVANYAAATGSTISATSRRYDQRGQQPNNQYDQRSQQPYDQRNSQGYNPPPPARTALRKGESIDVQPGDTLYKLSRRHHVSVAELMEVNSLSNPSLQPGQKIYLPEGYAARHDEPAPGRERAAAAGAARGSVPSDLQAKYSGSYTVRQGESVYGISRTYGVPVAELQQANGITDRAACAPARCSRFRAARSLRRRPPSSDVADRVPAASPARRRTRPSSTAATRRAWRAAATMSRPTGTIAPAQAPRGSVASDKLRWPVNGKIITGFGQRNDGTHNDGINLSVPQGTAVHAAESGVVAYAGSELKGYGNLVLLRHDNGWVTAYAHNDELMVKRGDKVQRGQVIAKAGRTGSVDQPQVHFELRQGSKPVDPVPFLERL